MDTKTVLMVSNLVAISSGIMFQMFGLMSSNGTTWSYKLTLISLFCAFLGTIVILWIEFGHNKDKNKLQRPEDEDIVTEIVANGDVTLESEPEVHDPQTISFAADDVDDVTYVKNVINDKYLPNSSDRYVCQLCWRHGGKLVSFHRKDMLMRHFLTQKDGHYQAAVAVGESAFERPVHKAKFKLLVESDLVQNYLKEQKMK